MLGDASEPYVDTDLVFAGSLTHPTIIAVDLATTVSRAPEVP